MALLIYRISLNALKRYEDSNEIFMAAKKSGSKDKTIDIWISKNKREMAKCSNIYRQNGC